MTCMDCVHFNPCNMNGGIVVEKPQEGKEWKLQNNVENICRYFKNTSDIAEVVYCEDCIYARELDKNCELNREYYKHCALWRGDETKNVWHKYKKYYKDYSLVEAWGFCSDGERKGGTI